MKRGPWLGLALLALMACAPAPVRFVDGPVVTRVHDDADIPEPAEAEFHRYAHHIENFVDRHVRSGLDPVPSHPALDVNRWGEVPSSSWYERRGEPSPAQVRAGAGADDPEGPGAHFPWTITRVKVGGANPGFIVEDARGFGYLLKVDKVGEPITATAAGAVANRLFWALGYHVPDDRIVEFHREDLRLGERALARGVEPDDVDEVLAEYATRLDDGRYRALMSRFLPGKPVGGYSYTGTRPDDANDRIAHERRRSLRALRVFGAWLGHVDLKVDNTLDLYTERDGRRFLQHYLVDFDGCLGGYWAARHEKRIGWAYDLDLAEVVTGLPLLGLHIRPYEELDVPDLQQVGLFEAERYDPARWKPNYVNDHLLAARPADLFWAGTVLARLGPEHLRAAIEAGHYTDPRAEARLLEVLLERQRKTLRWALSQVTPVVALQPLGEGLSIAAEDALREAGLDAGLRYEVLARDERGEALTLVRTDEIGPAVTVRAGRGDSAVVMWKARDAEGRELPPTEAHYRRDASGWRLIGVLRDGE